MSAEMHVKMSCPFCSGHIEYERKDEGQIIPCPHCGQDIELVQPEPPPIPKAPHYSTAPPQRLKLKLAHCPDCGREVSRKAETCPQCGRLLKKRRGVFFYVFVGTLSLIGTVIILFIGFFILSAFGLGFFQAWEKTKTGSNSSTSAAPRSPTRSPLPPLTTEEQKQAQAILAGFERHLDSIEGITWYSPKPYRESWKTRIYLYIGQKTDGAPWLRLNIRYHDEHWLFVESYRLKIGDQLVTLRPDDARIERDNSTSSVWERYDTDASVHASAINTILAGDSLIVRFEGRRGNYDYAVPGEEFQALHSSMLVYRYLGGVWYQ
jgi:DNA-directed RNA polymerase subunit M/transcription elongation factor TFIIS